MNLWKQPVMSRKTPSSDLGARFRKIVPPLSVGLVVLVGALAVVYPPAAVILAVLLAAGLVMLGTPGTLEPFFPIYLMTLLLPLHIYININDIPLSTAYVFIGLGVALWTLRGLVSGRWTLGLPRETLPMSLFLLLIVLNSVGATDVRASVILGVQVAAYYALFLLVVNVLHTEQRIRRTVNLLLIGATVSSLLGVAQGFIGFLAPQAIARVFFWGPLANLTLGRRGLQRLGAFGPQGPDILYRNYSLEGTGTLFRAFGLFEGPTVYGWFSAILAVLAAGFWLTSVRNSPRLARGARWATLLAIAAAFLSWTRSAWLAMVVGISLILAFRRAKSITLSSRHWWMFGFVALLALSLVILVGYLVPSSAIGRMILSAVGGEMAASSNAGRMRTARLALSYIRDNPIMGAGLGNYPNLASGGTVDSSSATFMTAHNTYLELGVELGLPGLLAFVWLLITVFMGAQNLIRQPIGTYWHALGVALTGAWLSFIVMFMFGGNIVHPKWMTCWWLLAGLQASARRALRQPAHVKEDLEEGR
jgi:hypothetical protein